jgi:hypothetical protein
MKTSKELIIKAGLCLGLSATIVNAFGQTAVTLPDTSQTTTLNANVAEQAKVQVPASISFAVNDISSSTASAGQSVTITNVVLDDASKQLVIAVQANAATFTPPVTGAATWAPGDVTWNAATWTNATGSTGTLSNSAYNTVATCTADAAACSTTALVFTLGPKLTVKRSGTHSLVITWKFAENAG